MRLSRTVTGIIVGVVFAVLLYLQGMVLRSVLLILCTLAVWEMYDAFVHKGAHPARWVGIAYALISMPAYLVGGPIVLAPLLSIMCMVGLATVMFRGEADFDSAVATLFPMLYPGMMFTMIYPMQDQINPTASTLALSLTFAIAMSCDVAAYEVGTRFGRHKLAAKLSPKKTIEGALGGLAAAVLVAVLCPLLTQLVTTYITVARPYHIELPPLWQFAVLGLVGGVASQCGDLTASMIKRYCGIKDFGTLLPGHGGIMDRLDSVLFNAVAVYLYFAVVVR